MAKLVAGCFSRDHEKCVAQGENLGVAPERCYKNFEEMAKLESAREDGIDFVVIVTPNNTHYAVAKAFLEAGINVVCDKPLVTTLAEAEELQRIANKNNLLFMVTYTYTGHVTMKYMRELVKSGEIGTHVENAVHTVTGLKVKRVLAKMDVVVPGRKLDDNDQISAEY